MARHTYVRDIPECPECGAELRFVSRYIGDGSSAFGNKVTALDCNGCGWRGEFEPWAEFCEKHRGMIGYMEVDYAQ